jgi:hypothetical protein
MPSTTDNETMIEEASAGQEKDEPKQKHEPVQQRIQASFHLQQQHARKTGNGGEVLARRKVGVARAYR